jgi:hypothetical protein
MAKTRREWNEISEWPSSKLIARAGVLRSQIETLCDSEEAILNTSGRLSDLCDEVVYIFLCILRMVVREKKWKDITPLELFEFAYSGLTGVAWEASLSRFLDTKQLVEKYKSSPQKIRNLIKPKLISRGII